MKGLVRVEVSHDFPVGRERGFDYITDPANWPHYWPGLAGVQPPGPRWRDPGDAVALTMRLGGLPVTLDMRLEQLRRPELVVYRTRQRGLPDAHHERHFEPAASGFTFRAVVAYEPRRGPAGALDRTVVARAIRRALQDTVANLDERLSSSRLGEAFARALAAKDFAGVAALLHPEIEFRGLTPGRQWEASGPQDVVSAVLRRWYEDSDEIEVVVALRTDAFAGCEHVSYRLRGHNPRGPFVVEQQAYLMERDGRIGWLWMLCSGFRRA